MRWTRVQNNMDILILSGQHEEPYHPVSIAGYKRADSIASPKGRVTATCHKRTDGERMQVYHGISMSAGFWVCIKRSDFRDHEKHIKALYSIYFVRGYNYNALNESYRCDIDAPLKFLPFLSQKLDRLVTNPNCALVQSGMNRMSGMTRFLAWQRIHWFCCACRDIVRLNTGDPMDIVMIWKSQVNFSSFNSQRVL